MNSLLKTNNANVFINALENPLKYLSNGMNQKLNGKLWGNHFSILSSSNINILNSITKTDKINTQLTLSRGSDFKCQKKNFSKTIVKLNNTSNNEIPFKPYGVSKSLKYKIYEGKNPKEVPYPYKFYYYKLDNNDKENDSAAVSLISPEQLKGKGIKKNGIIGWIKFDTDEIPVLHPWIFIENKEFNELLNNTIKENLHTDISKKCQMDSHIAKEGWLYFKDERNKINYGLLEKAEDVFGAVEIKDGEMITKSFEPMFTHRLVTSLGLFQLPEALHNKLVQEIQEKYME